MPVFEAKNMVYDGQHGKSNYDFYWDQAKQIVHVKDLCIGGTYSVTHALMNNTMSFVYILKEQFEKEFNFRLPHSFRLYVYAANSEVKEWRDDNIRSVRHGEFNLIHIPYLSKSRERKYRAYIE